jgi:hypothetical protein
MRRKKEGFEDLATATDQVSVQNRVDASVQQLGPAKPSRWFRGSVYVVAERSFVVLYNIANDVVLKCTCGK